MKLNVSSLPTPTTEAINKSQELVQSILAKIQSSPEGISFAEYMQDVLYTPSLGYYASGILQFGKAGDFITAPELSPLFSRCLAHQCRQVLSHIDKGSILEIGAGSGQMAADILIELASLNALPNHYYILELSADLQQWQQENLNKRCPQLLSKVQWLSGLSGLSELSSLSHSKFRGIILGNELCDAMPVHKFQMTEQNVMETRVIEKNGLFEFKNFPLKNESLALFLAENQDIVTDWPMGYQNEINLNLKPWLLTIAEFLEQGVILLIDYGFPRTEYYHPDRSTGTLMCHYRHYAHTDPFFYPGLQDLTAHVDFTTLAETALDAHLEVLGFTNQASFLLGCGLVDLAREQYQESHAINVLTSTAEMGELFKAIALGKGFDEPLIGFQLGDQRYRL